jgi:hypothetical protein
MRVPGVGTHRQPGVWGRYVWSQRTVNPREPNSTTACVPPTSHSRVTQPRQHTAPRPRHVQGGLLRRRRPCMLPTDAVGQLHRRPRWPPPRLCRRATLSARCVMPSATWRMPVRDQAVPRCVRVLPRLIDRGADHVIASRSTQARHRAADQQAARPGGGGHGCTGACAACHQHTAQ